MRAVVVSKPGSVEVREVPDPSPEPDELLVQVHRCGICGTDLHIVDGEYSLASYPIVPGHEFSGEVVAVGRDVTGISAGTLVTADPNEPCGRCRPCREGHGNLCENFKAIGVTVAGACAELVRVPYWLAKPLPAGFDMSVGALVEPLSCVVHGYDVARPKLGDRFLVYGAGAMGLMLVALAARVGALSVSVVEPNSERHELARSFGADTVARTAEELGAGQRYEIVIDASGVVGAIEDALARVAPGGTFLQFGVAASGAVASFAPYRLFSDELRFVGSMAVLHSFDRACDLAVNLDLGLGRLVSDVLPLSAYPEAIESARHGKGLKVQVAPLL
ncbi:MAG: zinc-dependent alcohol dehydrogenase family protein [Acidimicrobiales bacterium]